jgi:hypothetical protein
MLSPGMLVPCSLLVWRIVIWGDRLELCSVDSDSLGFVQWTSKAYVVIIPKSMDRFVEQPPMIIVQP